MSATTISDVKRTKSPTRYANKHEHPPTFSCKELAEYMDYMPASQFNDIKTFYINTSAKPDGWVKFLQYIDAALDDRRDRTTPSYAKQLLLFVNQHLLIPSIDRRL